MFFADKGLPPRHAVVWLSNADHPLLPKPPQTLGEKVFLQRVSFQLMCGRQEFAIERYLAPTHRPVYWYGWSSPIVHGWCKN